MSTQTPIRIVDGPNPDQARIILRREYGLSANFITPHILAVGVLPWERGPIAYEISRGGDEPGMVRAPWDTLYGVCFVLDLGGRTHRLLDSSGAEHSAQDALDRVERVRLEGPVQCRKCTGTGRLPDTHQEGHWECFWCGGAGVS